MHGRDHERKGVLGKISKNGETSRHGIKNAGVPDSGTAKLDSEIEAAADSFETELERLDLNSIGIKVESVVNAVDLMNGVITGYNNSKVPGLNGDPNITLEIDKNVEILQKT